MVETGLKRGALGVGFALGYELADTRPMKTKGRLQEGMDVDIVVFDPATVTDKSTMANGALPSTGIPFVIVNGTIVVKDSKVLGGVYPGKPVRLPER